MDEQSLVDRPVLYDRHTIGDVGDRVLDRLGNAQAHLSIRTRSGIYKLDFLELCSFPKRPDSFFRDRFVPPLHSPQLDGLPSFLERDQILSGPRKTATRWPKGSGIVPPLTLIPDSLKN